MVILNWPQVWGLSVLWDHYSWLHDDITSVIQVAVRCTSWFLQPHSFCCCHKSTIWEGYINRFCYVAAMSPLACDPAFCCYSWEMLQLPRIGRSVRKWLGGKKMKVIVVGWVSVVQFQPFKIWSIQNIKTLKDPEYFLIPHYSHYTYSEFIYSVAMAVSLASILHIEF